MAARDLAAAREREDTAQKKQMELKQALDESEKRALAHKQSADARQMELKRALDESGAKSEALVRELASARNNDAAARDLAAAREREDAAQKKQMELKQALDESEKKSLTLERENVAQKQSADARQMELKRTLDESGAKSEALARELASARKNDAAARDLAAAREREDAAQKKQMELKQALDESGKRALALEHEKQIADARQTELKRALDESEKRARTFEHEKQIADAKQTELKRALDESGAKSEALVRDLASARKNDVAARDLTAAREREDAAQKKQLQLKQALDESEKRASALERELTSAREIIAMAEKPSNVDVAARDAALPTAARPTEGSNGPSEITGSKPTPRSGANVTIGLQTSSDVTPRGVKAGDSGRLTRSNRSQAALSEPPHGMTSAEEAKLVARAESLINQFDFASARLLLANALEKGSGRAAFMMAETYDGEILRSLQAFGVRGDAQKAREFYQLAAAAGIEKARERAEALQSDANLDARGTREDRSR